MQRTRDHGMVFPEPLEIAEFMVTAYADAGKLYWRLWGPLGEPVIQGIDTLADMQRQYLRLLLGAYA